MAELYKREWYAKSHKYTIRPKMTLKVGKWDVGYIDYDFTSLAPRGKRHMAICTLPGMERMQGYCSTEKEAKEMLEKVVTYWFYYFCYGEQPQVAPVGRVSRTRKVEEDSSPSRVRRSRPAPSPVARHRRSRLV